MTDYQAPTQDMAFTLLNIAQLEAISQLEDFDPLTPDDLEAVLGEAGRLMSEVIAPTNRTGDLQGASHQPDGSVKSPDGFREAYDAFVQAGWGAAPFDPEWGGANQPWVLGCAISEMLMSANLAFSLCPMLTQGAIHLLEKHGTETQKHTWLPKLISGEWAGTMNLTEPQAGSDVGALTAKAVRQADGSYRLSGQKIFITWGEHDLTDNIIHLVLARTPDAAPGTKGISCFIVPKFKPVAAGDYGSDAGSAGERNQVHCISIEHKLGLHASPTCVLQYGDETEGAYAEIIGEEQQGMRYMFAMMNSARLSVGLQGLAASERALQQALAFAQERRQGRTMTSEPGQQAPIVAHPDVKRMLLTMKSITEAMRNLLYYSAAYVDQAAHTADPDDASLAQERVELLTPVCKAWCTDWANDITSLNIQVHGGMGYIEETGAAQHYRDIRIAAIYEGTNGIQALDLLGRKLPLRDGAAIGELLGEVAQLGEALVAHLPELWPPLEQALEATRTATAWLADNPGEAAMAGATPYLKLLGSLLAGWLSAKAALVAQSQLDSEAAADSSQATMLRSKVLTTEFFVTQILPTATALLPAITAGDDQLAAIDAATS